MLGEEGGRELRCFQSVAIEVEAVSGFPVKRELFGVLICDFLECDYAAGRAIILDIIEVREIDRHERIGELVEHVEGVLDKDHGQIILRSLEVISVLHVVEDIYFFLKFLI